MTTTKTNIFSSATVTEPCNITEFVAISHIPSGYFTSIATVVFSKTTPSLFNLVL